VKFPDAEGFRHPVVLYDGIKNFLLVPLLLWVRRQNVPPGRVAALFVFLYAALRIPIDLLREYPIQTLGLPTGQAFNLIMAGVGLALLARNWFRKPGALADGAGDPSRSPGWRPWALAGLIFIALIIPSDATRDVPDRYGKRHPGLTHSRMYPDI
jgi:hypothetical protein